VTVVNAYRRNWTCIAGAALLLLAGCSGYRGQQLSQAAPMPQPAAVQQGAPTQQGAQAQQRAPLQQAAPAQRGAPVSQYRLDAGDELRVIVFGQENLSGTFKVDDSGAITMPLLPPLSMRGLTPHEAKRSIEQALAQSLLRNPNVAVEVSAFRPFFILGQVNSPGQYPYVAGMTVETAVAIAGGYTYRANKSRARITRVANAATSEFKADVEAQVFPGDTIFIRERFF